MTVAKTRFLQPIKEAEIPVTQKALVIGGGIAGMTSALSLADQGYETVLVEKEPVLGGYLNKVYYTVEGIDIDQLLKETVEKVQKHDLITVYTDSSLESLKGYVGSYESGIKTSKETVEFNHGVVVVTVGASEYKPSSYLYGEDSRVLTQSELEKKLSDYRPEDIHDGETFVMIQCVESRDEKRPYCSRICCMQAVKNAIKIKELNPRAEVFVLYRDLMTYGFKEKFYKDARMTGVMFLQYDAERKPIVDTKNGLMVKFSEPMLQRELEIPTDTLVLSTGLQPNLDNLVIAQMLKVPTNDDGFFLEAHVKLRPVDFSTRGVFVAGNCHTPKFISESIYQAQAAAARAATILAQPKLTAEPNIAVVDEDLCCGCKTCITVCPYNAIDLVEDKKDSKVSKINEGLCQGCGTCVSTCPSSAIQQLGFKDKQILPMIDETL
jgi:heterodisulfide reductase subunit A